MPSTSSIDEFRQFYANLITRMASSTDDRLRAGFADVDRELFVGAGPWAERLNIRRGQTWRSIMRRRAN